jgi:hypothetical protein
VLDICSSWISHYPEGAKRKRTVGMGMNKAELAKNKQLDEYVVKVRAWLFAGGVHISF